MDEPTLLAGDILVSDELEFTFVLRVCVSISVNYSPGHNVARLCLLAALLPHPGSSWLSPVYGCSTLCRGDTGTREARGQAASQDCGARSKRRSRASQEVGDRQSKSRDEGGWLIKYF